MSEPSTPHPTLDQYQIHVKLRCNLSGLPLGELSFLTMAGTASYLSHWNELVAKHPVFSMDFTKLLKFTRSQWDRLAQGASDGTLREDEENILRVSFLATLHTLGTVQQDGPVLPPLDCVLTNMQSLLVLATWKHHMQTARMRWPKYHISTRNTNWNFENFRDYLQVCFDTRKSYENTLKLAEERAQVQAAEEAAAALAGSWANPVSKTVLWRWVQAHLPKQNQADGEGWMATLFLAKRPGTIHQFDFDELTMMRNIVEGECPNGTGVMFAVRARLDQIEAIWKAHYEDFSVELADYAPGAGLLVNGVKPCPPEPGDKPQMKDFSTKTAYYLAEAGWSIAKRSWDKYWQDHEKTKMRDSELAARNAAAEAAVDDLDISDEDI